jgi:hypothetical protein
MGLLDSGKMGLQLDYWIVGEWENGAIGLLENGSIGWEALVSALPASHSWSPLSSALHGLRPLCRPVGLCQDPEAAE